MNPLFSSLLSSYETRLYEAGIPQRLGLGAPGNLPTLAPVPLSWSVASRAGVDIDLLPLDQLHPVISGNKWFKLKYNLLVAAEQGRNRLASCGGAHSNHLHALAWAGQQLGWQTWAAVRGEELSGADNPTLVDLQHWGMALEFVSRQRFRYWREQGWGFFDDALTLNIPEGGDNYLGILGCMSLAALVPPHYAQVHVACGTGCTFLGLRIGLPARVGVVGYSMLRGDWQQAAMRTRLAQWSFGAPPGAWSLAVDTRQRFGRTDAALLDFMAEFACETGVLLDPVYTGNVFWRMAQRLRAGEWALGTRLLVIHSGGLQGRRRPGEANES